MTTPIATIARAQIYSIREEVPSSVKPTHIIVVPTQVRAQQTI